MARITSSSVTLPSASEFSKNLEQTTEQCRSLLSVKGPTSRIIPANIRTQMRSLERLNAFWAKNKAAYTALVEAAAASAAPPRAQRAASA